MSKTDIVVRKVSEDLKNKFKAKAAKEGTSMTAKLREWIKDYIED